MSKIALHFMVSQQVVPALINAGLNGWIAWAMHREATALGLWGDNGYAFDLLATGFLLPAITWWILRPLLQKQQASGKAPVLEGVRRPALLGWMRPSFWGGSVAVGVMGMVLVGGLTVLLMQLLGAPVFDGPDYAVFKGVFAAVLVVVLQPVMVFAALDRRPAV